MAIRGIGRADPSRQHDLVKLIDLHNTVQNQHAAGKTVERQNAEANTFVAAPQKQALHHPGRGSWHWMQAFRRFANRMSGTRNVMTSHHSGSPGLMAERERTDEIPAIPREADSPLEVDKARSKRTTDAPTDRSPAAVRRQDVGYLKMAGESDRSSLVRKSRNQRMKVMLWLESALNGTLHRR
ncbi:hypothetical protein [Noviherbaspirillum cavernae]|nr:hypothetical protein [Noviherbaspirillum cavernae]